MGSLGRFPLSCGAAIFERARIAGFFAATRSALFSTAIRLVHRRPRAGLGLFLRHSAVFVTFLDVQRLTFLFASVTAFISLRHGSELGFQPRFARSSTRGCIRHFTRPMAARCTIKEHECLSISSGAADRVVRRLRHRRNRRSRLVQGRRDSTRTGGRPCLRAGAGHTSSGHSAGGAGYGHPVDDCARLAFAGEKFRSTAQVRHQAQDADPDEVRHSPAVNQY